jgi:hypothetical protein
MPTRPGQRGTTSRQAPPRTPTSPAAFWDAKREVGGERSFRTGLILTIVLLILLAAIAVWSALFLPDSPVARLLGGGSDVALDDPLDAPDAPLAITAPPAIGELASVDAPPASVPETGPEMRPETAPETSPETRLDDAAPEDEAAADGIELADTVVPPPPDADPAPVETVAPEETAVVPPLPPLPLDSVPSLEETEAVYAEYRIWQRPPDRPDLAPLDSLSDLSLSSVDPAVAALDAISLPSPRLDPTETLRARAAAAALRLAPRDDRSRPRRCHRRRRGHARWRPRHRRPAPGSGHSPPA